MCYDELDDTAYTGKMRDMEMVRDEYDELSRRCRSFMEEGEDRQTSLLNLLKQIIASEKNKEGYEFMSSVFQEINYRANDIMGSNEAVYQYLTEQYRTIDEQIDEMKYCNMLDASENDTTQGV